jgi:hypothetical protein
MKGLSLLLITLSAGLVVQTVDQALAGPHVNWNVSARSMSKQDCLNRAKSELGKQGLTLGNETAHVVSASAENVTVVVQCLRLGDRTAITVVAASSDSAVAVQFKNSVSSADRATGHPFLRLRLWTWT